MLGRTVKLVPEIALGGSLGKLEAHLHCVVVHCSTFPCPLHAEHVPIRISIIGLPLASYVGCGVLLKPSPPHAEQFTSAIRTPGPSRRLLLLELAERRLRTAGILIELELQAQRSALTLDVVRKCTELRRQGLKGV